MNPKVRRIIRTEQIAPGHVVALWDDGDGNRWYEDVMKDYEYVW